MNWKVFAEIAGKVAVAILPMVNPALAPLASVVGHAIGEAEAIQGATGEQKLAHVQNIVAAVAPAIPGLDANAVNESLQEGIDTVVAATNVIVKR